MRDFLLNQEFQKKEVFGFLRIKLLRKKKTQTNPEGVHGEKAHWLRAVAALVEDCGLVPRTNMATYNCL